MAFQEQLEILKNGNGFIAALDQSGGSTPKALREYGVDESSYSNEDEMFAAVHEMRTRIITADSFNGDRILGAILFEKTMDSSIEGQATASYLWNELKIVPFLKIDKGLAAESDGVQLMKPMPELESLLDRAVEAGIFGTKMRSLIKEPNAAGIKAVVKQQFEVAKLIISKGLVPIIEPEVSINSGEKSACEEILREEIIASLQDLGTDEKVIFKVTLPEEENFYSDVQSYPNTVRVVALSGGYDIDEACSRLAANEGMIASFSRALSYNLKYEQTDEDFNEALDGSISKIYEASLS